MKRIFLIAVLVFLLGFAPAGYSAEKPREYQVKAAYLFNFAKFINWPENAFADPQSPLVIGVLGKNPFHGALASLSSKKIRNRAIEISYFKTLPEVEDCHLLYISKSENKALRSILKELAGQPIVTVGGLRNFVSKGGTIQFVTKRDRLRFSINLGVAKQNNIQIESQLLALAAEVLEGDK